MKKILLILITLLINLEIHAQMRSMHSNTGEVMRSKRFVDVEGTPYLITDWQTGEFIDVDDKNRGDFQMRYNIYDDELEVIRDDNPISLNDRIVYEFSINSPNEYDVLNKMVFRSGYPKNDHSEEANFYQVLCDVDGKQLLKKYNCIITEIESKGYGGSIVTKKFLHSTVYFLFSEKTGFEKINKSKKGILEAFSSNQSKVKAYIKSKKLSVKKDEELAQIVEYCYSII